MFCIAGFIVFAILGIFSARYRRLAKEAWACVARKATLRKCDTNFKNEAKARLLGKIIVTRPRLAKWLDAGVEVLAFIFVMLIIWSSLVVVRSGLNLFVYNTCDPANSESCSLGAEACSVESVQPQFWQSLKSGHPQKWLGSQVSQFDQAIKRIPDRLKKWDPGAYTNANSTYYHAFNKSKPVALEIIDPSCSSCAKLFKNIQAAGVPERYNYTYIAFPIPNPAYVGSYKFPNSYEIASYLQAIKTQPLKNADVPADWQILQRIFTWVDSGRGIAYQGEIASASFSHDQVKSLLHKWLANMGYSPSQITAIDQAARSNQTTEIIKQDAKTVQEHIKTVKIPTLLLGTRRYDGVTSVSKLQ